jgi:peptidoglycan/LPS O-acetylase OafA/YrhL
MFLAGAAHAAAADDRPAHRFRHGVAIAAFVLLAFACTQPRYYALPYNKEVLLGLLLGLGALSVLRRLPFSRLDEFLGNLSYGVFLNHFIVIWWLRHYRGVEDYARFDDIMMMLLASILMAAASFHLVERPAIRWRRSIRLAQTS